jgi:sulfatase maturation enzyme AslB (radical SAM superfamily)
MLDYWNYFKKVKINASVDAYGDLNRYIRYPTNWKLVEKNLAIFDEMQKDSRVTLQIHITVQMYNILHLDKLFDYLIDRNFTDIYLNILNHPSYLNIRTLPLDLKLLASQRLEKYIKIKKVSGLISYMNSEDWSNNINKFIQYTKTLDSSRGEDCRTVSPEVGRIVYAQ